MIGQLTPWFRTGTDEKVIPEYFPKQTVVQSGCSDYLCLGKSRSRR